MMIDQSEGSGNSARELTLAEKATKLKEDALNDVDTCRRAHNMTLDAERAALLRMKEAIKVCIGLGMKPADVAVAAGVNASTVSTWVRVPREKKPRPGEEVGAGESHSGNVRAENEARPVSGSMT